jgi:hypothetical protein
MLRLMTEPLICQPKLQAHYLTSKFPRQCFDHLLVYPVIRMMDLFLSFLVYTYIALLNFQFLHISWKICLF